jgi:hypothetical protein
MNSTIMVAAHPRQSQVSESDWTLDKLPVDVNVAFPLLLASRHTAIVQRRVICVALVLRCSSSAVPREQIPTAARESRPSTPPITVRSCFSHSEKISIFGLENTTISLELYPGYSCR